MPNRDVQWVIGTMVVLAGLLVWRIDAGFTSVNARMDRIEMRLDGFDERLRNVEIAFGKVDQRLATLERLHLPAPGD